MRIRSARSATLVLACAAGLFLGARVPGEAAKARAVFRETAFDFGKVKQGEVLTHEFVFRNAGDKALVVDRVETSCGCTAALASADEVAPGKEGRIKVSMDTHGYAGPMRRYVYVLSNDSEAARRELSLSADIEVPPMPRIDIDKYNIDLGLSLEGEAPSTEIVVKNVGQRELSVEMAHQEIQFFSHGQPLSFPVLIPAGKSVAVQFRFLPQKKTGVLRDYVIIRSNDPIRSALSVYVSRYVVTKEELKELFKKYRSILGDRK
jgi:hypothetical protein